MSPQRQWWVAGALLCVAAYCAPRARADGASPWPPLPGGATSVVSVTGQAPLALVRPVAVETVERALAEADALYRSRQSAQAMQAYATLVEIDAANPQAWLRLGNLHQQAGRDDEATDAYRRAVRARSSTPAEAEARGKALLNIALIGVAEATRAIDALDAMGLAALDETRDAVASQVVAQQSRAARSATRWTPPEPGIRPLASASAASAVPAGPAVATPTPLPVKSAPRSPPVPPFAPAPMVAAPPAAAPAPAPPPAARPPVAAFEPFTVDRWIAKARRAVGGRTVGRSALTEPVTETPLPPLPVVETHRGGSGGRRP